MDKFLRSNHKAWKRFFLAIALVIIGALTFENASAGTYTGYWTGYAMGNRYGASNYEIYQGDFANHPPSYWDPNLQRYRGCPNDPAANWAWGTQIYLSSGVSMLDYNSLPQIYHYFYLYDNGDPDCTQGNYWVDVYFGRYRRSSDSCNCPGSPSPGYCIVTTNNSCTAATNFGRSSKTYTGP